MKFWDVVKEVSAQTVRQEANRAFVLALAGDAAEVARAREVVLGGATGPVAEAAGIYLVCAWPPYTDVEERSLRHADLLISLPGGPSITQLRPADTLPVESAESVVTATLAHRPDLALCLGRRLPGFRREAADYVIRSVSRINAEFAAVAGIGKALPVLGPLFPAVVGADVLILTKNQIMLIYRLAAIYGDDLDFAARLRETIPVIAGALGWRTLARQMTALLPGFFGIPLRTGIAFGGTYAVGRTAEMVFDQGRGPNREELRKIWDEAGEHARAFSARLRRKKKPKDESPGPGSGGTLGPGNAQAEAPQQSAAEAGSDAEGDFRAGPIWRALEAAPRVALCHQPTPLQSVPRLAAELSLQRLYLKRDDCTGLALGGNKARKLEYLLAEPEAVDADVILTTGGVQSNHARMTAAAACRLGKRCVLVLGDPEPENSQGNYLLDQLFGAETRFLPGASGDELQQALETEAVREREQGRRPYIIPLGGSTPVGALGYVRAVAELADQAAAEGLEVNAIVVATGSAGTLAGILLGVQSFLPGARVYGVSVSGDVERGQSRCHPIASGAAELLGTSWDVPQTEIRVFDDWVGPGYAIETPECLHALDVTARTTGVLLDPVYTGKAMAGLIGLRERGEIRSDENVVFWHTGGAPALFAFNHLFSAD